MKPNTAVVNISQIVAFMCTQACHSLPVPYTSQSLSTSYIMNHRVRSDNYTAVHHTVDVGTSSIIMAPWNPNHVYYVASPNDSFKGHS